jgi:hypothetical protein
VPAARPLVGEQEKQEADRLRADHQHRLDSINQELGLYDPAGPWRYFEERLKKREARAIAALETGPIEEVPVQRAILALIRDLLDVPQELMRSRELLIGDENG